ncbi:MAG: leucine-rich repeat protein [Oscillospiraceae bacterium]|nr:leucine-rich repeat protein [Oscillospiraceae bacterium]
MKKVLCLLIAVCMIASVFPVTAFAAENGSCGENAVWSYADGVLTISGTGAIQSYENEEQPWDEMRRSIMKIVVEEGITAIGDYAFQYSLAATEVVLPQSLREIGEHAFEYSYVLEALELPEGLETIGENAFAQCKAVKKLEFPAGITQIPDRACEYMTALEEVVIPEGVTAIGEYAFADCTRLTRVELPEGLTELGWGCFDGCRILSGINFPSTLTSIPNYCFDYCAFTELTLPETLTEVCSFAFWNNEKLTSLNLPEADIRYGESVFANAEALTQIQIPDTWEQIPRGMFQGSGLTSIVIPEGVQYISEDAFAGCLDLAEVQLPQSLKSMFDYCFTRCRSLKEIELPGTITNIPWGCFQMSGLERIEIPEGVRAIHEYAFSDCDALTEVILPESMEYLEECCFRDCDGLTAIELPGKVRYLGAFMFADSALREIVVPDSVTEIRRYAFSGCKELTNVVLPDTLEKIGESAFNGCTALKNVQLPSALKEISNHMLCDSGITELVVPEGVREIVDWACTDCDDLQRVVIPANVVRMGDGLFDRSEQVVVHCWENTAAHRWCVENEQSYVLMDENPDEPVYSISLIPIDGGTVTFSTESAKAGRYVSFDMTAEPGYLIEKIFIWYKTEAAPDFEAFMVDENTAAFYMPPCDVMIEVLFAKDGTEPEPTDPEPTDPEPTEPEPTDPELPENPFTDVSETDFYYDAVLWAAGEGITSGTSATTFGPYDPCRRAQVVTFLWRAMGSPKAVNRVNPFSDVKQTDYYYEAVLWAVEQGITSGVAPDAFGPDAVCSRGQIVTFLYRALGEPQVSGENPFADVKPGDYFYTPVLWAVEAGVTSGVAADSFAPGRDCVRAQVVTFLYKALADQG